MTTTMKTKRPTTGIRHIDQIDGGMIAWLYGETDLDDVLLEIVGEWEAENDGAGVAISSHRALGPDPRMPDGGPSTGDYDPVEWQEYHYHCPPYVGQIDEDISTAIEGVGEVEVGWFRRFPWCTCGEGHSWHFEESARGRGASLAVLVSWSW